MDSRRRKTIESIFKDPVSTNVVWRYIDSLLNALGCEIIEGIGSRVRLALNGVRAVFDRPHPNPKTDRGEEPDRPYSGNFVFRIDPQLHRKLAALSQEDGSRAF